MSWMTAANDLHRTVWWLVHCVISRFRLAFFCGDCCWVVIWTETKKWSNFLFGLSDHSVIGWDKVQTWATAECKVNPSSPVDVACTRWWWWWRVGCRYWTSDCSFPASDCTARLPTTQPPWTVRCRSALCHTDTEGGKYCPCFWSQQSCCWSCLVTCGIEKIIINNWFAV